MYVKAFETLKITVTSDAKTGNKLNHSSDVDIDESIGKNLFFLFILICSQKIDNG